MPRNRKSPSPFCPICGESVGHVAEVSRQVCLGCTGKITDENGRRLVFWSMFSQTGSKVTYLDNDEPREGNECFINGILCRGFASKSGGFYFQVAD